MHGNMLVELGVQRATERVEMWALYMAQSRLSGTSVVYTDNLGVVQALRSGEESFMGPKHQDADWWKPIMDNTQVCQTKFGTSRFGG